MISINSSQQQQQEPSSSSANCNEIYVDDETASVNVLDQQHAGTAHKKGHR